MARTRNNEAAVPKKEPSFSVPDWSNSDQFTDIQKDFIQATVSPDKKYTLAEIKEELANKMKEVIK